jgi:hypothetical protein
MIFGVRECCYVIFTRKVHQDFGDGMLVKKDPGARPDAVASHPAECKDGKR